MEKIIPSESKPSYSQDPGYLHELVFDYLRATGRVQAALRFAEEADMNVDSLEKDTSFYKRGAIRNKILKGDAIGAIELLNDTFPELLDRDMTLFFKLRLLAFVEMLRIPNYDLDKALQFAEEEFTPCPSSSLTEIEEVMTLLAFEDPAASPFHRILEKREHVANLVNDAILSYLNTNAPRLTAIMKLSYSTGFRVGENLDVDQKAE